MEATISDLSVTDPEQMCDHLHLKSHNSHPACIYTKRTPASLISICKAGPLVMQITNCFHSNSIQVPRPTYKN